MAANEYFDPTGLRILVVDDHELTLHILRHMLQGCSYNVTTVTRAEKALSLLRENPDGFDLVLSDVMMPDMDGFKLLEMIGLTMDLPVIMMSANAETSVVMKGITHGACDYLIKPIRIEELKNIWQHVIRKRARDHVKEETVGDSDDSLRSLGEFDLLSKKRKDKLAIQEEAFDDVNNLKKARVLWSKELHEQFVRAVNHIGIDKAVPTRILEVMSVHGLTRENVASHLQKYRMYLKRLSGIPLQPHPVASFQASGTGTFGGVMQIYHGGKNPSAGGAKISNTRPARGGAVIDESSFESQQQRRRACSAAPGAGSNGKAGVNSQPQGHPPQTLTSAELDNWMVAAHEARQQLSSFPALVNNFGPSAVGELRMQEELEVLSGLVSLGSGPLKEEEAVLEALPLGIVSFEELGSPSPSSAVFTLSGSDSSFGDYSEFPAAGVDILPPPAPKLVSPASPDALVPQGVRNHHRPVHSSRPHQLQGQHFTHPNF